MAIAAGIGGALLLIGTAFAASYTLFGDAQIVSPGNASPHAAQIRSDCPGGNPACFNDNTFTFGGVDYAVPAGTTFADFQTLATDYMFTQGTCGGGAPRFQIDVVSPDSTDTGTIFVYIGPPPNYNACPMNVWANTGDLLEGVNPIDTSQLNAGTFYDPYTAALVKYGAYTVTGVQVVTDGGWAQLVGTTQTARVDNTNIDGTIYTYDQPANADECKKGGWTTLTDDEDQPFKNQGQCVSFAQHQRNANR